MQRRASAQKTNLDRELKCSGRCWAHPKSPQLLAPSVSHLPYLVPPLDESFNGGKSHIPPDSGSHMLTVATESCQSNPSSSPIIHFHILLEGSSVIYNLAAFPWSLCSTLSAYWFLKNLFIYLMCNDHRMHQSKLRLLGIPRGLHYFF